MARVCQICGKKPVAGVQYSHSHRQSKKTWKPNIKKVKAVVNGKTKSYPCFIKKCADIICQHFFYLLTKIFNILLINLGALNTYIFTGDTSLHILASF